MKYELVVVVVDRGYSEVVMNSARESGARGGTILNARGSGANETRKIFGTSVSPDKELILILSTEESRNAIMTSICKSAGLNTMGKGLIFSIPVNNVLGISLGIND